MSIEHQQPLPTESLSQPQVEEEGDVYERIGKLAEQLDEMNAMNPSDWPEGSTDYYKTMRAVSQQLEALQAPLEEAERVQKEQERRKAMGGSGIRFFLSRH